jgi:multidrug efflux pump subunit AcrB
MKCKNMQEPEQQSLTVLLRVLEGKLSALWRALLFLLLLLLLPHLWLLVPAGLAPARDGAVHDVISDQEEGLQLQNNQGQQQAVSHWVRAVRELCASAQLSLWKTIILAMFQVLPMLPYIPASAAGWLH